MHAFTYSINDNRPCSALLTAQCVFIRLSFLLVPAFCLLSRAPCEHYETCRHVHYVPLMSRAPCLCPAICPDSCTHAAITARPCSQRSHMPPSAQQLRDTAPERSRNAATPRISSRHSMNTTNERLTAQYERTNEHRRIFDNCATTRNARNAP